jgi:hypothetical protein
MRSAFDRDQNMWLNLNLARPSIAVNSTFDGGYLSLFETLLHEPSTTFAGFGAILNSHKDVLVMKKFVFVILLTILGFEMPAFSTEFREQAMCTSLNPDAAFPRISIQTEPLNLKRAILILVASDGWTQVYSGPIHSTKLALSFVEDGRVVTATFLKTDLKAHISFSGDDYVCDSRSFGD